MIFPIYFVLCGCVLADRLKWLGIYLGLSAISVLIHGWGGDHPIWGILQLVCHTGAFFLLFRGMLKQSLTEDGGSQMDRVITGVAGYLLLGVFWLFQFVVAGKIDDVAFVNQLTGSVPSMPEMLYFSFVTLTTLGYGDILPVNQSGKVLITLTTLSGVLYLAVFISTLIAGVRQETPKS